ncbi:MAG TPA: queuosine salvage family protein [bacterium]|nr:queuosine salvage family protein [bacterium]
MGDPYRFDPPAHDPLGVLTSTASVARDAAHVRLDAAAAERFAVARGGRGGGRAETSPPEDALHCRFLPVRRRLNYLLVLEALNFSFWEDEPRWRVPYRGQRLDGYWALAAALHRAIVEDATPLWDAHWLANLRPDALAHLLRGEGRAPPLMEARLAHLREAGRVLLERWGGQFANLVAAAGGDAVALVHRIVAELPSFRDEATWQGAPVRFYKRAQICVADLARLVPDDPLGRLQGLEQLTAFADYKVPQVLRAQGVLVPGAALAERMERGELLPPGSAEEVELRAATIWGVEWIARALNRQLAAGQPAVTASEVDYLLWTAGQDKTGLQPYHRTRTVYY